MVHVKVERMGSGRGRLTVVSRYIPCAVMHEGDEFPLEPDCDWTRTMAKHVAGQVGCSPRVILAAVRRAMLEEIAEQVQRAA